DQESQLGQLDVATLDAAVRPESDPAYLGRGHCSTPIRAARTNVSKRTPDGAGSTCEAPRGLPSDDGRPLSLEAIRLLGVAVLLAGGLVKPAASAASAVANHTSASVWS